MVYFGCRLKQGFHGFSSGCTQDIPYQWLKDTLVLVVNCDEIHNSGKFRFLDLDDIVRWVHLRKNLVRVGILLVRHGCYVILPIDRTGMDISENSF